MSNIALIAGNLVSDSGASLSSKADLVDGKVPSTQLPSYVDDVLEYANLAGFPVTGEAGKIYVAQDSNKIYRWSGTTYIEVSPTVGTVWGGITGTLLNQTDLQAALDAKVAGTGAVNYIPKFTGTSALGNSQILDNGTNVGIGVVPLATTLGKSLSIGSAGNGLLSYDVGNTYLTQNTYYNEAWKYANSAAASQFILFGGEHLFYTAPSGTAGTNVTLTERMRITSAGNVGIGTTNPDGTSLRIVPVSTDTVQRVLHIGYNGSMSSGTHGSLITFGNSTPSTAQLARIGAFYEGNTYMGSLRFYTNADTEGANPSEKMRITQAGNVGIGATSPTNAKLVVAGTSAGTTGAIMSTDTAGTTSFLRFLGDVSSQNLINWQTGSALRFATSNQDYSGFTERLRIDSSGNLGIGTTSPINAKLQIVESVSGIVHQKSIGGYFYGTGFNGNDAFLTHYTQNNFIIGYGSSTGGAPSVNTLTLTNAGNVGIGRVSANTRLDIDAPKNTTGIRLSPITAGDAGDYTQIGISNTSLNADYAAIRFAYENGLNSWYNTAISFHTFARFPGNSLVERMRIDGAGNVGIGTATPVTRLDVFTTSTNGIDLRNTPTTLGDQTSKNSPRLRLVSSRYEGGNVDAPFSFQNVRTGSPTNDQRLAITNFGDVEVMSILNAGNVGIANPNPVNRLHVYSPNRTSLTATGGGINLNYNGSTTGEFSTIGFSWASSVNDHTRWGMGLTGTNFASGTADLFFFNGGVERMRVNSFGHVGIGVTPSGWSGVSPSLQLGVSPFIASTGQYLYLASNMYYDGTNGIYTSNGSATTYAQSEGNHMFNTAGSGTTGGIATFTERMRITSGGNVGIGTQTPALRAQINASGAGSPATSGTTQTGALRLSNGYSNVVADFGFDISNNVWMQMTNAAALGTNYNLLINPNGGNVGIGTTSPNARLEVRDGDISVSTFNTFSYFNANRLTVLSGVGQILGGLRFQAYSTGTTLVQGAQILAYSNEAWTSSTAATYLSFQTTQSGAITTTERMRIFPNGRIGINTTTDAGYQLDVNGGTRVTGRLTITGNDTLAQTMSRAGTSAFSAEIYNSGGDNSWLIWGVESSVGGVIFPGSTAYAAVIGQFRNTPLEFFTNNTIRGSFSGAGAFRVHNLAGTGSRIVVADANGVLSTTDTAPVTGTGTTNYIPKFTAGSTIGNSQIFADANGVGIGITDPASYLAGGRQLVVANTSGAAGTTIRTSNTGDGSIFFSDGTTGDETYRGYVQYIHASDALRFGTSATERLRISSAGVITVANLAGSGARLVVADASGNLSATTASSSIVAGSGTTNYVPKFTAASTIGNSQIFDNGTQVGINTASPASRLHAFGTSGATTIIAEGGTNNAAYGRFEMRGRPSAANQSTGYIVAASTEGGQAATNIGTIDFAMSGASGNAHYMAFSTHNGTSLGERLRIFANGRIGVNTTTDAGYQFDINGTLRSVNGANFATNGTSHIGMGTVPSAWSWPNGVTQFRFGGHIAVADNSFLQLGTNSFYDGSNYVRVNAGYSSRYLQNDGGHFWSTAITSTAGSTVTFNEQMRMTRDGELLINTTSDAGDYKLQVSGNIYNTGSAVLAATSGNVGVGLVPVGQSGFKTLEIGGTGVSGLIDVYQGTTRQLRIYNSGSDTYLANVASGGGMLFRTTTSGGTQNNNVAIFTTGRVGVNTTTDAGYQLDVNGSFRASGVIRSAAPVGVTTGFFQLDHAGAQTWKIGVFSDNTSTFSIGNDLAGTFASRYLNITNAGNVLIGTTTSLEYRLQVNGSVYNTGQVTAGVINIQGTGAQLFVDGTTNLSPLSAIQTLSGASNSAFLSGNVTWNTTGSPNAIDISVTNTASGSNANFMQLGDGTNNFKVTKDAGIITANPTSGTARKWKLGSVVSSTVVLVTSQYVEVEINGTFYRLALVTPA